MLHRPGAWTAAVRSLPVKKIREGFNTNSLAQTFALLYAGAGLEGASSHSGRRTFLTIIRARKEGMLVGGVAPGDRHIGVV